MSHPISRVERTRGLAALSALAMSAVAAPVLAASDDVHLTKQDIEQGRRAPLSRELDASTLRDGDSLIIGVPCDGLTLEPAADAGPESKFWGPFNPTKEGSTCVFVLSDALDRNKFQPVKIVLSHGTRRLAALTISPKPSRSRRSGQTYGPSAGGWFWMFHFENDIPNSDQNYTDGERLEIGRVYESAGFLDAITFRSSTKQLSIIVGLNMYTPTDISWPEIIPDERPYAGWAYVGGALASQRWRLNENDDPEWQAALAWEVSLGVLGDAPAGFLQEWIHANVSNSPKPIGWKKDFHVNPVPALYLSATYQLQVLRLTRYFDVLSVSQVELGNVFTRAHQGGVARAGWFRTGPSAGQTMPSATPETRTTTKGPTTSAAESTLDTAEPASESWSWDAFAFGRMTSTFVLWNGTLQGGFAGGPHTVTPRRLVYTGEFGAQLGLGNFFINISHVWRGPEVDTLLGDPFGHDFTQARIGWMPAPGE